MTGKGAVQRFQNQEPGFEIIKQVTTEIGVKTMNGLSVSLDSRIQDALDLLGEVRATNILAQQSQDILAEIFSDPTPIFPSLSPFAQGLETQFAIERMAEREKQARHQEHVGEIMKGKDRSPGTLSLRQTVRLREMDEQEDRFQDALQAQQEREAARKARAKAWWAENGPAILAQRQQAAATARELRPICRDLTRRIQQMDVEAKRLRKFGQTHAAEMLEDRMELLREAKEATSAILTDLNEARINALPFALQPPVENLIRDEGLRSQVKRLDYRESSPLIGKGSKPVKTPRPVPTVIAPAKSDRTKTTATTPAPVTGKNRKLIARAKKEQAIARARAASLRALSVLPGEVTEPSPFVSVASVPDVRVMVLSDALEIARREREYALSLPVHGKHKAKKQGRK